MTHWIFVAFEVFGLVFLIDELVQLIWIMVYGEVRLIEPNNTILIGEIMLLFAVIYFYLYHRILTYKEGEA